MDDSRRGFLKKAGVSILGFGCAGGVASAFGRALEGEKLPGALSGKRWALIVDTRKCAEQNNCTDCVDVCHLTHNVPHLEDEHHEIKWIWKEEHRHVFPNQVHSYTPESLQTRPTLVLCNHCAKPPCVRVCPTQATWKRESDGLVMMDMHRCIGCRYCAVACPYGSRSFNWTDPRPHLKTPEQLDFPRRTQGVVEKCNFCAERLARGMGPACVEACQKRGTRAMVFGDLGDPDSEVSRILRTQPTIRRKPALGTEPHVFYVV